jgi:DNA topoisomerase IA
VERAANMSTATILMVAEKPSIAQAIAGALSGGRFTKRKGISPSAPVFELQGTFPAGDQRLAAHIKVTSTVGHVRGRASNKRPLALLPLPLPAASLTGGANPACSLGIIIS